MPAHCQCSGRNFASGEVILFAATILHVFEISSVDGKELQLPGYTPPDRFGGGAEFPARPWQVRLRFRQR
jgi:hypothetical protein